ncbi:acetyl-CoA carboxylase biotin carboxyl carrier protein [Synechococcus sp. M16CYN]|uniref:acetyl-CoA carboxylase biotin carboxyl carrier protein n=1 Tax=Synechococcus sp. M16CYN TaxID=3103139 RepID=UPI0030DE30B3
MAMHLDYEQLHQLLQALGESDIQEFRLEGDDFRLEVRRNIPGQATAASTMPTPVVAAIPATSSEPGSPPPVATSIRSDLLEITAPMVGTFYRAPAPGEPSFVEVGTRISVGQAVCILEAMKLMNELESEVSGEITEILVENGTPVEFGQVLMRVKST